MIRLCNASTAIGRTHPTSSIAPIKPTSSVLEFGNNSAKLHPTNVRRPQVATQSAGLSLFSFAPCLRLSAVLLPPPLLSLRLVLCFRPLHALACGDTRNSARALHPNILWQANSAAYATGTQSWPWSNLPFR